MPHSRQPSPAHPPGTFAPGHAIALEALARARSATRPTPSVASPTATPAFRPVDTAGLNWSGALDELRKAGAL